MAGLRNIVKEYRDEIIDGIAWVAMWKDGRSWEAQAFYPQDGSYEYGYNFSSQDYEAMLAISGMDHKAICVNGYYTAEYYDNADTEVEWRLGELPLNEIEDKILYFYETRLAQLEGDFLYGYVYPPKTYDLYESKGLSAAQLRVEYRGLTGLDNDYEFTDEEIHEYLLDALREKEDPSVEDLIAGAAGRSGVTTAERNGQACEKEYCYEQ